MVESLTLSSLFESRSWDAAHPVVAELVDALA